MLKYRVEVARAGGNAWVVHLGPVGKDQVCVSELFTGVDVYNEIIVVRHSDAECARGGIELAVGARQPDRNYILQCQIGMLVGEDAGAGIDRIAHAASSAVTKTAAAAGCRGAAARRR